ncbi:zinc ribbon domain-containing protein [Granulicella sibirica]|uniref:Adenylate cyclase n=1 Tax=Granulicella sibirica TaxID=2479048 RepID=A0A4Q0SZB2_9BACT|nr:zinc ribbon domain-containing protein [Granulicella sibirica]RXH54416.1 Adenylate cyclase [Granulicella sibirica]
MTMPWNKNPESSMEPSGGDSELALIPRWSVFLAIVVFIATQYLFHEVMPHSRHEMLPMRLIMGYSSGTAFASYVLLVGYVSRDVKRRRMSAGLWMLLVILMPGGIGAVVYFLLRQPVLSRCPNCTTELAADYHFCPQCQFQMSPACGKCFRSVQITDVFCVQCGHDLAEDHVPARLRAYRD